eukprot:UC1_evm1s350
MAQILLYSPPALDLLRRHVAGRRGYLVPAVPSEADYALAAELGLPLLGPPPALAARLSTHTARREWMATNSISMPAAMILPPQADTTVVFEILATALAAAPPLTFSFALRLDDAPAEPEAALLLDLYALVDGPTLEFLAEQRKHYGEKWTDGGRCHAPAVRRLAAALSKTLGPDTLLYHA